MKAPRNLSTVYLLEKRLNNIITKTIIIIFVLFSCDVTEYDLPVSNMHDIRSSICPDHFILS
jgi:hypothetical protein